MNNHQEKAEEGLREEEPAEKGQEKERDEESQREELSGGFAAEAGRVEPEAGEPAPARPDEEENGEEAEQRDEEEIAKHEAALNLVAEEFKEARAEFEHSSEEIIRALADPVLGSQIDKEKREIKRLLRPNFLKAVTAKMQRFLFREEGQDPARQALAELDRRRKELDDKLDRIDLVSRVVEEKAVALPDLGYLEGKRRSQIRSRARFYGKKQKELLKNAAAFRAEVLRFRDNHKVLVAQKFLSPEERGEVERYARGLK